MPYISKTDRGIYDNGLNFITAHVAEDNKFNFFAKFIHALISGVYTRAKYCDYNEAVGLLTCCSMELQRRSPVRNEQDFYSFNEDGDLKRYFLDNLSIDSELKDFLDIIQRSLGSTIGLRVLESRAGHLNYLIYRASINLNIDSYIASNILDQYLRVIFYPTIVAPYEDIKISENGDVQGQQAVV